MINSIQSYQNTPRLSTNKAKANNSPNFGSEFTLKASGRAADILVNTVKNKQSSRFCGIVTAINNWRKGITGILEKDSNKASKVEAFLTDFSVGKNDLESAKVDIFVQHKDTTIRSSENLSFVIKRDGKGNYVIKPHDLTTQVEAMMRNIDNAKSDAEALRELGIQAENA